MKRHAPLLLWLLVPHFLLGQIGIGTATPNSKSILDLSSTTQGLLIPRMTSQQKSNLSLTAEDCGMLVFQTDAPGTSPKGLYVYDGAGWNTPLPNGTVNGQTLRWDGQKWAAVNNLFNQGSAIGIGMSNPNYLLHLHTLASPYTRIQLTNTTTGALNADGLMIGVALSNGHAHVSQFENRPLWFGTNATERMRIDSTGNVGIGKSNPEARLDVNGTVRLGSAGSIIQGIIKFTTAVEVPVITSMQEASIDIPCPNAIESASVYVSPGAAIDHIMIGYARVSEAGMIQVKFMNMGPDMTEPMPLDLNISVIQ